MAETVPPVISAIDKCDWKANRRYRNSHQTGVVFIHWMSTLFREANDIGTLFEEVAVECFSE